ncbi:MAG TPA: hypothetical protein VFV78_01345 [Vicinamibacterales bacterium]|nr:hypothetical protein [Vicinamibacterales bacterium]
MNADGRRYLDPVLGLAIATQTAFGAAFIASARFEVSGRTYFTLFDDAMVSMTYARNLAEGHGLVWNAGGAAVEGYTNFLWTLWMALLHAAGIAESHVSLAVGLSGLAILLANLVVLWQLARVVSASRDTARLTVLTVSLCYPLIFWTLRGMEVGLLALVLNLALLQALSPSPSGRRRFLLLVSLGLLPLIRADGIVPAAIVGAVAARTFFRNGHTRTAVAVIACPFVVLLAHTAFRWWLYGDLLPNTYYLKVSGVPLADRLSRGAGTLWETLQSNLWLTLALGLLIRADARLRAIAAVVIAQAGYSVWVGGDAWEQSHYANRYLAAVLPLAVLLGVRGVEGLLTGPRSVTRLVLAGVAGQILLVAAVIDSLTPSTFSPLTWTSAMILVGVGIKGVTGIWLLLTSAMIAASRPLSSWPRRSLAVPALGLIVTLSGPFIGEWLDGDALHVRDDERAAKLGLALRELTSPDATIAVTWAGNIPYFARRTAIDLLGKSDVHVAHVRPRLPFVPGHDKWDYAYSVGELQPDVVVQTWRASPADIRQIQSYGYDHISRDAYVRAATSRVDVAPLAAAFAEFDRTAPTSGPSSRPQR